jgi:O-antigen ligase
VNKYWPIATRFFSFAILGIALAALPFSITVCHVSLIFFLVLWAVEGSWREKLMVVRQSLILQVLLAFMLIMAIGIAYSSNPTNGWFALEKKIFFFLIPIAMATSTYKLQQNELRVLFYIFTGACFVGVVSCTIYAIGQTQLANGGIVVGDLDYLNSKDFKELHPVVPPFWMLFSYVRLADGINLHPSYFSLFLAFCILFLLHEIVQGPSAFSANTIRSVVIFIFSIFSICLSSRIILLSLAILYIVVAVYWFWNRKWKMVPIFLVALLITSSALLYFNPVSRYRNIQEIQSSSFTIQQHSFYETSAEIRASLWWLGWKSFRKTNPLFGAGTGEVHDIMAKISQEYEVTNALQSYDPHNQYLFILISNGIFGLITLIVLMVLPFLKALALRDYLFMGFSFLFAMLCITETALELQKGIVFFTLVFSLLAFQRQSFQTQTASLKFFGARS